MYYKYVLLYVSISGWNVWFTLSVSVSPCLSLALSHLISKAVCYLNNHEEDYKGGIMQFQDGDPSSIVPVADEKERQSWEATCESLWSEIEASENACLKSEIESAKVNGKFSRIS